VSKNYFVPWPTTKFFWTICTTTAGICLAMGKFGLAIVKWPTLWGCLHDGDVTLVPVWHENFILCMQISFSFKVVWVTFCKLKKWSKVHMSRFARSCEICDFSWTCKKSQGRWFFAFTCDFLQLLVNDTGTIILHETDQSRGTVFTV